MIQVEFNCKVFEVKENTNIDTFLRTNDLKLHKEACCAKIDGNLADLRDKLVANCKLEILNFNDD